MLQQLQHLEKLVLENGFDEESKKYVQELKDRVRKAIAAEELARHTAIAPYIQHLKDQIAQCKEILSEDDKLTEKDRLVYFERKRQCREFLSLFEAQNLEQEINQYLDVAKTA